MLGLRAVVVLVKRADPKILIKWTQTVASFTVLNQVWCELCYSTHDFWCFTVETDFLPSSSVAIPVTIDVVVNNCLFPRRRFSSFILSPCWSRRSHHRAAFVIPSTQWPSITLTWYLRYHHLVLSIHFVKLRTSSVLRSVVLRKSFFTTLTFNQAIMHGYRLLHSYLSVCSVHMS